MTLGTLAAIRAIVAIHGGYGRDHLLAQLDAAIEVARTRETPSETGIADVESGGANAQF